MAMMGAMACQNTDRKPVAQADDAPVATPDSSLAGVFTPWDGHWRGTFTVYTHEAGQTDAPAQPEIRSKAALDSMPLRVSSQIQVEQIYTSESPFYQRVRILDTYPDEDGQPKTVESTGYNTVRGDTLICVVNKPEEQVIHQGRIPADSTIIWARELRNPLKIEYFYESVEGDTYSIVGWGYYGQDDPQKAPKTWFYAAYQRQ